MAKKQYWDDDKMKKLAMQWQSASTESEYTKVYNAMYTPLYKMFDAIRQRYFRIPQHNIQYVRTDCLTTLFTNMDKYDPSRSAFSYFQNVIKNAIHEHLREKNIYNNLDYFGDKQEDTGITESSDYTMVDNRSDYINHKQKLIDAIEVFNFNDESQQQIKNDMITAIQEFDFKSLANLGMYLYNNGHKTYHISKVFKRMFKRSFATTTQLRNEEKLNQMDFGKLSPEEFYNDFIPPDDTNWRHHAKKRKNARENK